MGKDPLCYAGGNLDFYSKTKEKPQKFPKQVGKGVNIKLQAGGF